MNKKYQFIYDLASALFKYNMVIKISRVASILNDNDITNSYGNPYTPGARGIGKTIMGTYKWAEKNKLSTHCLLTTFVDHTGRRLI